MLTKITKHNDGIRDDCQTHVWIDMNEIRSIKVTPTEIFLGYLPKKIKLYRNRLNDEFKSDMNDRFGTDL